MAGILVLLSLVCLAQTAQPQSPEQSPLPRLREMAACGKCSKALSSRQFLMRPFTAMLATEWGQIHGQGATLTLVDERHIARDRDGRVYLEYRYLVPKNGKAKTEMNWIQIAHPDRLRLA